MLDKVPRKGQENAAWMLRSVAGQLGAESVQEQYYRVADRLSGEFPQLGYLLDIACEEMVAYTCFTLAHWWKTRRRRPSMWCKKGCASGHLIG